MTVRCPNCAAENKDTARFCKACGNNFFATPGSPMQPPAPYPPSPSPSHPLTGMLPANTMLASRYIISRKVGQGGMAAVYDAIDLRTNRRVALKEMSDSAITDQLDRLSAVQQFHREAQILANLDHPNLPKVTDVFDFGGKQYLAMDFVDGVTLETMLQQKHGPLPEAQVKQWAAQLCDVLSDLHAQQIIFRDLKPSNIMIDRAGSVKLIDFGIARLFKPGKSHDTVPMGTLGYAAPEQHQGAQSDARTDIYALGVTLYELLTGYDPTSTPMSLPPIRQLQPYISPVMESVITRALDPDRARRWQSVSEIRLTLTGPLPTLPAQPPSPGGVSAQPSIPRRPTTRLIMTVAQLSNRQIALAGTVLLIVIAVGLWFGVPILAQYPVIWNNLPSFAIVAPLIYAAVRRPWIAPISHVAVVLVGALITGARLYGGDPGTWRLEMTLVASAWAAIIIEVATRLLPKVRGKRRDDAWLRELAWLDAMAVVVSIFMAGLVWGWDYGLNPIMWIGAAVLATLGWFIGDSIQQALFLKQTGIKRGRGG